MLKPDVLIDLFFTDEKMPARVSKIADCGYKYIETWKGGDANELREIADAGKECGVKLVSIVCNSPAYADAAPVDIRNKSKFIDMLDRYSDNALSVGCSQGIVTTGPSLPRKNYNEQRAALVENLCEAGEMLAKKKFMITLEMLNTEVDHPGYFLNSAREGIAIIKEVGLNNVKVLYDIYHMGIMTGNLTVFIEENIEFIGHFHSAGIPGRHELFKGETNYPFLISRINKAGYSGFFGLEYFPTLDSKDSLMQTYQLFQTN